MEQSSGPPAYNRTFEDFNDPLMQRFRDLAYGEDIGQHSWTSADELRGFCAWIKSNGDVIDFGCGAGGPLAFIVKSIEGRGAGCDISESALQVARGRAKEMGLSERVSFFQADCKAALAFPLNKVDAAISIELILHLRDRCQFVSQISRILKPGGIFIFTDAGVMTGTMTEAEQKRRTLFGHTAFVPQGVNQEALERAGLVVQSVVDSTDQLIVNAAGRLRAREVLAKELIAIEGHETFRSQITYLETVIDLAQRQVLSRFTYTSRALRKIGAVSFETREVLPLDRLNCVGHRPPIYGRDRIYRVGVKAGMRDACPGKHDDARQISFIARNGHCTVQHSLHTEILHRLQCAANENETLNLILYSPFAPHDGTHPDRPAQKEIELLLVYERM